MRDITNYSPAVRALMADTDAASKAVSDAALTPEFVTAIIAMMHNPYVGAAALTVQMVAMFEGMVVQNEATDTLDKLRLVD